MPISAVSDYFWWRKCAFFGEGNKSLFLLRAIRAFFVERMVENYKEILTLKVLGFMEKSEQQINWIEIGFSLNFCFNIPII